MTDTWEALRVTLRVTPTANLLTAAYSLTHRIHAADRKNDVPLALSLRDQRDLIDAEIIRRTQKEN